MIGSLSTKTGALYGFAQVSYKMVASRLFSWLALLPGTPELEPEVVGLKPDDGDDMMRYAVMFCEVLIKY